MLPWQPPSTLAQMTNQRSVSIARPGPISGSHQPPSPAGIAVAGQRVEDDHGIVTGRIEFAPGPEANFDIRQHASALERQRTDRHRLTLIDRYLPGANHPEIPARTWSGSSG